MRCPWEGIIWKLTGRAGRRIDSGLSEWTKSARCWNPGMRFMIRKSLGPARASMMMMIGRQLKMNIKMKLKRKLKKRLKMKMMKKMMIIRHPQVAC